MADTTLSGSPSRRLGARIWASRTDYLFLVPGMLIFGAFILYPIFASEYFSLLNWSGFDANAKFVGLANYAELLQDSFFWNAFTTSFALR